MHAAVRVLWLLIAFGCCLKDGQLCNVRWYFAGLLKDTLRKYWLEQIRGMEASKAKAVNKTPREVADLDSVCMLSAVSSPRLLYTWLTTTHHSFSDLFPQGVYNSWKYWKSPGNTGTPLEFEIPPGNTGNLVEFC